MADVAKKNYRHKGRLFVNITMLLAAMIVILTFLESFSVAEIIKSQIKTQNTERYQETAVVYADLITRTIDEYAAHLDFYTKADISKTADTPKIVEWLMAHEGVRDETFDYVAWVDKEGGFYSDIGTVTQIPDRDYFQAIMLQGKDFYIDNPVSSKVTGKTIVHICKAVNVNGRNIGFYCGVVNVNRLVALLEDVDLKGNGAVLLLSGDGTSIAFEGDEKVLHDIDVNDSTLKNAGKNGVSFWSDLPDGNKVLNLYAPVNKTFYAMVMILTESSIISLSTQVGSMMTVFSILLAVVLIFTIAMSIYRAIKPLSKLEKSMNIIATGNADLTKRINLDINNEIGRVVDSFNQFVESLQETMSEIKETKDTLVLAGQDLNDSSSETALSISQIVANIESVGKNINVQSDSVSQTAGAVNEIASNIESLNKMIEGQAAVVTQASASIEQMISSINSVSGSIQKMSEEFKSLEVKSSIGLEKQDAVYDMIGMIGNESKALQEANIVISNIASQTNLLAMNAAIEAAHAGEAGKGFSVVADEIRKLSETSSSQSRTIGEELKKIVDGINSIVAASQEAKQAFQDVSGGINQTNDLVQMITNSMYEQGEGSKQIAIALGDMNDSTSEVKNSSVEMAAGNKAILEEIKKLQDATISMKQGMDEMAAGATQINSSGSQLKLVSDRMEDSIARIGDQVDQFRV